MAEAGRTWYPIVMALERSNLAEAPIRHGDMTKLARLIGRDYEAISPDIGPDAAVAKGLFRLVSARPGLLVHSSDAVQIRATSTKVVKQPGLTISLALRGRWQGEIGGMPIACGGGAPEGFVFSLAEPDHWIRHTLRGATTRMVNVMVTHEWLEQCGFDEVQGSTAAIAAFCHRHLATGPWQPSNNALAIAEQILRPPPGPVQFQQLYSESRAIQIVAEVLHTMIGPAPMTPRAAPNPQIYRRMRAVRELVETELTEPIALGVLARRVGLSISSLQRQFSAVYGTPIVNFLRVQRLQRARDMLEQGGMSVSEAAYRAGYGSPANFATAFKRHFGISPKRIRARN